MSDVDYIIDDEHPYEGKTWWELRPTFVLLPPASYAKLKAYLIKNCRKNNDCAKDVSTWERKMRVLEKTAADKGQGPIVP